MCGKGVSIVGGKFMSFRGPLSTDGMTWHVYDS